MGKMKRDGSSLGTDETGVRVRIAECSKEVGIKEEHSRGVDGGGDERRSTVLDWCSLDWLVHGDSWMRGTAYSRH
jgi:hypothetical protein